METWTTNINEEMAELFGSTTKQGGQQETEEKELKQLLSTKANKTPSREMALEWLLRRFQ